jgi:hypothetical protein
VTLATVLSYWSGLAFVGSEHDLSTIGGTMLVLHTLDAIMCRLFARNNGYPKTAWTVLGFVGGIWAVMVLILLPRRTQPDGTATTR